MGLFDIFRKKRAPAAPPSPPSSEPPVETRPTRATSGPMYFEGGDGETIDDAILVLGAPTHSAGIKAEYDYLTQKYGRPGSDWTLEHQALVRSRNRPYDEMVIRLADGTMKVIFFDLTDFFGRR